ncbi:MAG: SMI1/KNR4 family protein [Oscillospiraceae bacterium]
MDAFEKKRGVRLSPLYRALLLSHPIGQLMTIMYHLERVSPLWMELDGAVSMEALEEQIEILQEMQDYCELPDGCFQNLIPIGDFGAGWGPMCLDLSRPEESVDPDNEETWAVVWFDHEEFDWDRRYLGEDGLLHGRPAAPDLKTLLEWCLCGSLETEFEEKYGIRPTYEWYQNGAEY